MVENIRSQMQQGAQAWKQLLDDQLSLVSSLNVEVEKLEKKGVEHASTVVDELTRITKDVVKFGNAWVASQESLEAWKKVMGEQASRMQAAFGLFNGVEGDGAERAKALLEDYAEISKNSLKVATDLQSEWRRMSIDTIRRSTEWMIPR